MSIALNNIINKKDIDIIIGNDLDALLSACLLKSRFGWDIVGIYDYQSLWFDSNLSKEDLFSNLKSQQYLAVDLDIYRNYLPSIGHHILSLHNEDILPQHENTINPNLINGVTHQNFKQKYPLGTVHLLMWMLNEYPKLSRLGELLLWFADSTFINAQSHRFRDNVKYWLNELVPNRVLNHGFEEVDTESFEEEMEKSVFPVLQKSGLARGKGQVRSRYKKLQGYQCQWKNPNESRKSILSLLNIIYENTGWEAPELPHSFSEIAGNRNKFQFTKQDELKDGFLRNFLGENKVFSYVITNRYLINYTTGIDF
jgi:hypothetical protein